MKNLNVLHIVNWFPNKGNLKEAVWIKRQIEALPNVVTNKIYHFEILEGREFRVCKEKRKGFQSYIIKLPIRTWFVKEWIYLFWLIHLLIVKRRHKEFDIINFHIAYPILTYWHLIKRFIKKPIIITEHWSAYHFNFGVQKELPRIQKIFRQNIPVIAVSDALANDIKSFAKADFPTFILPNIVDQSDFNNKIEIPREEFFFMLSQWKSPKNPFVAMEAFLNYNQTKKYLLKIGGYGPQWNEIKDWVRTRKANNQIKLIGKLDSKEIALNLQKCKAFLHPTNYETFSVVCAEAVSCGAYVIAPKIGGIPEVLGENGNLLKKNDLESWIQAFEEVPLQFHSKYDGRFNPKKVGKKYYQVLQNVISEAS